MEHSSHLFLCLSIIFSSGRVFGDIKDTELNCTIANTSKGFITADCSGRHLKNIPRWLPQDTRGLDLSDNNIEQLLNGSFYHLKNLVWLKINKCQLKTIEADAFLGLTNLKSLEIHSNFLRANNISNTAFKSLVVLEDIDISDNYFHLDKKFPEKSFVYLIKLKTLTIDIFEDSVYGPGFQNFSKLTALKLLALSNQDLVFKNDTFTAFTNVPLKYLSVSFTSSDAFIKYIDYCVFCPLKSLKGLDIIGNKFIHLSKLMWSLYGLRGRTMEYLMLHNINRNIHTQPVSLTTSDTQYLKTMCFKTLSLANNYIVLDANFSNALLSLRQKDCIQEIDISYSIFVYDISPFMALFTSFKNLRIVRLCCLKSIHSDKSLVANATTILPTYKEPQSYNFSRFKINSMNNDENIRVYLSPNIEFINASYLETTSTPLRSVTIIGGKLKTLDFFNAAFSPCTGEIKGLSTVLSLNVSGWGCRYLNSRGLKNLSSLEHLEFKNSNLDEGLKDDEAGQLFKNLKHLSVLKLSNNELVSLHSNLFFDQYSSLKDLYLDGNKFTHIPIDVTKFSKLEYIDMSNNEIKYIKDTQRDQMDNLYSRTHKLEINLGGNMLLCSCDTLDFLSWLTKTRVTINGINSALCVDAKGISSNMSDIIDNLDVFTISCISNFWLIFSIVGTSILVIGLIVSSISYRYRFFIEYTCLRVRMYLKRYKPPEEEYRYHAFVAYSSLDAEWVTGDLYSQLKTDFNICLYDKDFVPGKPISDNIISAIDSSRKVIFVVTRHLLESSWGNYEMEMTRMHAFQKGRDNMIIVIIKDNLTVAEMPRVLQSIWWKVVCLVWDDNPSNEASELLWTKLRNAVSD